MRKRGAALPTAIGLCTFLLIITFVVTSLIIEMAMINKLNIKETDANLLFVEAHNTFVSHDGDISSLDDDTYNWKTYDGEDDIKALVAYYKDSNSIKFYSIYDFDVDAKKTLAYQVSVQYIPSVDGVLMLGGIVPIGE